MTSKKLGGGGERRERSGRKLYDLKKNCANKQYALVHFQKSHAMNWKIGVPGKTTTTKKTISRTLLMP